MKECRLGHFNNIKLSRMEVHIGHPSTWKAEAEKSLQFTANLTNTASSKPDRPHLKRKQITMNEQTNSKLTIEKNYFLLIREAWSHCGFWRAFYAIHGQDTFLHLQIFPLAIWLSISYNEDGGCFWNPSNGQAHFDFMTFLKTPFISKITFEVLGLRFQDIGAREMVQLVRALAVLEKDLGLILPTR